MRDSSEAVYATGVFRRGFLSLVIVEKNSPTNRKIGFSGCYLSLKVCFLDSSDS